MRPPPRSRPSHTRHSPRGARIVPGHSPRPRRLPVAPRPRGALGAGLCACKEPRGVPDAASGADQGIAAQDQGGTKGWCCGCFMAPSPSPTTHHTATTQQAGPLVSSFFEAPADRAWMAWALEHYGARPVLDLRVSGWCIHLPVACPPSPPWCWLGQNGRCCPFSSRNPLQFIHLLQGRGQASPLHFALTNNDPSLIETLLDLGKAKRASYHAAMPSIPFSPPKESKAPTSSSLS